MAAKAMPRNVSTEAIRALREKTSAPIGECRSALEEAGGDPVKAEALLRQRGIQIAQKRQDRATGQGRIESYIHHDGRLGALVEVNCESDFVARTPDFVQFCKDVALHVAAMGPKYLRVEDVPVDAVVGGAAEAKMLCLLEQPFVKDQGSSVGDLLNTLMSKTGEKIVIKRFATFTVGEG